MKKSELRQMIKEEIKKIKEDSYIDSLMKSTNKKKKSNIKKKPKSSYVDSLMKSTNKSNLKK